MKLPSASQDPGEYDANGWGRPTSRHLGGGLWSAGGHGSPSPLPTPRKLTDEELEAQTEEPF